MILSGKTIREKVNGGQLGLDPLPEDDQYQPASLDIRLGSEVYDLFTDERYIADNEIQVRPGDRLLGHTYESVDMPNDAAAQVAGRSSLGRLFVTVHQTAGWIDPSYRGHITLEIANFSHDLVTLEPGDRVAQLVFFPLDQPSEGYEGQYQDDSGPQPSGGL